MATFNYNLGSLSSTPTQESDYLRSGWSDIYEFDINGTRNINLSLTLMNSTLAYSRVLISDFMD